MPWVPRGWAPPSHPLSARASRVYVAPAARNAETRIRIDDVGVVYLGAARPGRGPEREEDRLTRVCEAIVGAYRVAGLLTRRDDGGRGSAEGAW